MIVRLNSGAFKGSICIEHSKQGKGPYKIVNHFQTWLIVVTIARGGESIDACGMFVVLVRPKIVVGSTCGAELDGNDA